MTCRKFREVHNDYLDGTLPEHQIAEVHAHLIQCPECQRHLEMMRACGDVIALDLRGPRLSTGFAHRVTAALPAQKQPARQTRAPRARLRMWATYAGIPAMAAALGLAVLPLLRNNAANPGVVDGISATGTPEVVAGETARLTIEDPSIENLSLTLGSMMDEWRQAGVRVNDMADRMALAGSREAARQPAGAQGNAFVNELMRPFFDLFNPPITVSPTTEDIERM